MSSFAQALDIATYCVAGTSSFVSPTNIETHNFKHCIFYLLTQPAVLCRLQANTENTENLDSDFFIDSKR